MVYTEILKQKTKIQPIKGFNAACASTSCLDASGSNCSTYILTVAPADPVPCVIQDNISTRRKINEKIKAENS